MSLEGIRAISTLDTDLQQRELVPEVNKRFAFFLEWSNLLQQALFRWHNGDLNYGNVKVEARMALFI